MMASGNGAIARRTRIKLCGVTDASQADAAVEAGVDAIGMIFTRDAERSVLPHTAMQIARRIPPFVSVVGVFSNPSDPDLMVWPGRWVQLVGQENEPQIQRVARLRSIIKGFDFSTDEMRRWDRCPAVGAMLINAPSDKSAIDECARVVSSLHTPIIIGGALTPKTVGGWINAVRPHGIDLGAAALNQAKVSLCDFVHAVREADTA